MLQEIEIRNQEDLVLYRDILSSKDGLPHVGGYIRTATTDAVGNYSPVMQRSAIRDFCRRKFPEGCRLFWTSDIGASGLLPWKQGNYETRHYRTGLNILVDMMKQGSVENVCTYRIDRLTRSIRILAVLFEDCIIPFGISLYSVSEMIDSDNSSNMLAVLERHKHRSMQNVATAALQARIRDGYTTGKPPYGWISEDARMLRRSQRIGIEPVAAEAEIVRLIVTEYLKGSNPSHIAKGLVSSNVLSPSGTSKWSSRTVKCILHCPIHYGLVKSINGTLVQGAHFEKRLFDESVYEQVASKNHRKN